MSLDEISPVKQDYDLKHEAKDDTVLVGRKNSKSSRRRTVDKTMKRIIAPFCKVVRRGRGLSGEDNSWHRDVSEFQIFLSSNIDFTALLFDTANILKMSTKSTGVLVYLVDNMKNEIYLKPQHTNNVERHKVNWPIEEGKTMATHAAFTKEIVIIEDAAKDTRFSEGMTWPDTKTALCLPVLQPDNTCYAVLELYRTNLEPYCDEPLKAAQCCAGWIGAAVHQANKRVSIEQQLHLNKELLSLLMQYFSDQVSLDKMIYEMLTISKHCLKAMRSTLYIIDREFVGGEMMADIYDEGWDSTASSAILKKNVKTSLANIDTPHGLAATSGHSVNVKDVYSDGRFHKEVDSVSGAIVRSVLCIPLRDKIGVIGVISVMNKLNEEIFTSEDKESFSIIANYCRQTIQYSYLQRKCKASKNLNRVYAELLEKHMKPCILDLDLMLENINSPVLPTNFDEFEWYVESDCKDQIPELVFYMIKRIPGGDRLDSYVLSEFILSVLEAYRDNPYHNAEHAFIFTHTMYNMLTRNAEKFTKIEGLALIIGGFCHDVDHPGFNNSYLVESKHPLAAMYTDSILENHHFFVTQKMLSDKGVLSDFTDDEIKEIIDEIRYNILCTDLAIHFRIRAQMAPIVGDGSFDWSNPQHKKLIKSIMMTSCDLAVQAKPFTIVKKITEKLYEEFYNQGDLEREMGYTPLSMMDRTKSSNQATEQIQFLQIVVLPCLLLLQAVLAGTSPMTDFCMQAKESWLELNELRGKKLWQQMDSFARSAVNVTIKKVHSKEFDENPEQQ